jgi:RNA polymerase sigma factor (sigma-70 family)
LQSKKAAGFEALVRPHLKPLYRVAYRMTGRHEDAEDLIQELLTKLYPRREELIGVDRLRPWLIRVMYRLFIDNHRRQSRSPVHLAVDSGADPEMADPIDNIPAQDGDPETATDEATSTRLLLLAVDLLSEDHRSVLSLHDIEGYTLEEMQIMLDCPIGTLKSRLHRARARLRTLLDEVAKVQKDR